MNCNESTMKAPLPLVSDYARALLIKGRHIEYTELVYFPMEVKKYPSYYSINPKNEGFNEDNRLLLFPNPCGDYVIVYFNTIEQGHNGNLILYDIIGKELDRIRLDYTQNQRVINLLNYPDGTYLIRLIVDYQPVSAKLLIKGRK
jgi:hypothetical protein